MKTDAKVRRWRSPIQWVRDFDSRRPLWWDIGLPLGMMLATFPSLVANAWFSPDGDPAGLVPTPLAVLVWLMHLVPLVWRRRHPFLVLVAQFLPITIAITANMDMGSALALFIAVFNLSLRSPLNRSLAFAGLYIASVAYEGLLHGGFGQASFLQNSFVPLLMVMMGGWLLRSRRSFHAAQRTQAAEQAVAEERSRIAQEMHDIIGHNLAVITSLSDGGAYAARSQPERAEQAMQAIGSASREALSELRRVLGVLQARDEDAPAELSPQPGLRNIEELVNRVRETGIPVRIRYQGEAFELTPGKELAVYRTVQESLTNVLRHAHEPTDVEVRLDSTGEDIAVTVANTGGPASHISETTETGQGLPGMVRRAKAYGGTLEAGPRNGGGWTVSLSIPRDEDQ